MDGKAPDAERLVGVGHLANILGRHKAFGGLDCRVAFPSAVLAVCAPLQCAKENVVSKPASGFLFFRARDIRAKEEEQGRKCSAGERKMMLQVAQFKWYGLPEHEKREWATTAKASWSAKQRLQDDARAIQQAAMSDLDGKLSNFLGGLALVVGLSLQKHSNRSCGLLWTWRQISRCRVPGRGPRSCASSGSTRF